MEGWFWTTVVERFDYQTAGSMEILSRTCKLKVVWEKIVTMFPFVNSWQMEAESVFKHCSNFTVPQEIKNLIQSRQNCTVRKKSVTISICQLLREPANKMPNSCSNFTFPQGNSKVNSYRIILLQTEARLRANGFILWLVNYNENYSWNFTQDRC